MKERIDLLLLQEAISFLPTSYIIWYSLHSKTNVHAIGNHLVIHVFICYIFMLSLWTAISNHLDWINFDTWLFDAFSYLWKLRAVWHGRSIRAVYCITLVQIYSREKNRLWGRQTCGTPNYALKVTFKFSEYFIQTKLLVRILWMRKG